MKGVYDFSDKSIKKIVMGYSQLQDSMLEILETILVDTPADAKSEMKMDEYRIAIIRKVASIAINALKLDDK